MIPVLGVPVLNGWDRADQMIRSIDLTVGKLVVVANGDRHEADRYDWASKRIDCRHNLGVAASWNMIIRATAREPWWLITNHDVTFHPGTLKWVAEAMDAADGPQVVAFDNEFYLFALNQAVVDRVGWFDENFYPAYDEDTDYKLRCEREGVPVVAPPPHVKVTHDKSSTISDHRPYYRANTKTQPANRDYLMAKWGKHTELEDAFGTYPTDHWRLDRQRLVDNEWWVG